MSMKLLQKNGGERAPGHSHPPPLALLATAAAYDLASRIRSLRGCMASDSTSELLVMDESTVRNKRSIKNKPPQCLLSIEIIKIIRTCKWGIKISG